MTSDTRGELPSYSVRARTSLLLFVRLDGALDSPLQTGGLRRLPPSERGTRSSPAKTVSSRDYRYGQS